MKSANQDQKKTECKEKKKKKKSILNIWKLIQKKKLKEEKNIINNKQKL